MADKTSKTQGTFNFDAPVEQKVEAKTEVVSKKEENKVPTQTSTVDISVIKSLVKKINSAELNYAQKRNIVLELLLAQADIENTGNVEIEAVLLEEIKKIRVLFGFDKVQSEHNILEVIRSTNSFLIPMKDKSPLEALDGTQATPYDVVYAYVSMITPVAKQLHAQIFDMIREKASVEKQKIEVINGWEVMFYRKRAGGQITFEVTNTVTGSRPSGDEFAKALIMEDVFGAGSNAFLSKTHMKKILKQVYLSEDSTEDLSLSRLNRESGVLDKKLVDKMSENALSYDGKSFNTASIREVAVKRTTPGVDSDRATARDNKLTSIQIIQKDGKYEVTYGMATKSKVEEISKGIEEIKTLVESIPVIDILEIDEKVSAQKVLEIKQMLTLIKELKMSEFKEKFDLSFRNIMNYNANGIFFSGNMGGSIALKSRIVLTVKENGFDTKNTVEVKGSAFIHEFGHLYSIATDAMTPDYKQKLISLLSSFNDYERSNASNPEYYANPEEVFARATEVSMALVDANFFKVYGDLKAGKISEGEFHSTLLGNTPNTAGISRTLTEYTRSSATGFSANFIYFDLLQRTPDELAFMVKEFSNVVGYENTINSDISMDKIYIEISKRKHVEPKRAKDISLNYLNRLDAEKVRSVMIANTTEKNAISNAEYLTLLLEANMEDKAIGSGIRLAIESVYVDMLAGDFDLFVNEVERNALIKNYEEKLNEFYANPKVDKYAKRNFEDKMTNKTKSKLSAFVIEVRKQNPKAGYQEMCIKTLEALKKEPFIGLIGEYKKGEVELRKSKVFTQELTDVGMSELNKKEQENYLNSKLEKLEAINGALGAENASYNYLRSLSMFVESKDVAWTQRITNQEFKSYGDRDLRKNDSKVKKVNGVNVGSDLFSELVSKYNQKTITRMIQEDFIMNEYGQRAIINYMSSISGSGAGMSKLVDAEYFKEEMETLAMMSESERKFKKIILSHEMRKDGTGLFKRGAFLKSLTGVEMEMKSMTDSKEKKVLVEELLALTLVEGVSPVITRELFETFKKTTSSKRSATTMETNETKFISDGESFYLRGVFMGDLVGSGKKTAVASATKGGLTKEECAKVDYYLINCEKDYRFDTESVPLKDALEASRIKLAGKKEVKPIKRD